MASIINASTTSTSGLVQTADASGVLQLQSNGVTGLTVDTAANVTVNTNLSVTGNTVAPTIRSTSTNPPTVQNTSGSEVGQFARAWVYFDASSGTPTIKKSFNVSSITDNGVGDFTINFIVPMPDTNYCALHSAESGTSVSPRTSQTAATQYTANVTMYSQTFQSGVSSGARQDMTHNKLVVYG